jgi:hypothetical protein
MASPEPQSVVERKPSVDQHATAALYVSDLHWVWICIQVDSSGQAMRISCIGQTKSTSLTTSKTSLSQNTKSMENPRGTSSLSAHISFCFLEFLSSSSADNFRSYLLPKKITANFTSPHPNPFRTMPKETPRQTSPQPRGFNSQPYERTNYDRGRGYNRGRGNTGGYPRGQGYQGYTGFRGRGQQRGGYQPNMPMQNMPMQFGMSLQLGLMQVAFHNNSLDKVSSRTQSGNRAWE